MSITISILHFQFPFDFIILNSMMTSDFYNLKWLLYILKCRLYINKTFIVSKQIEEIIPVTVFLITSFFFSFSCWNILVLVLDYV